MSGCMHMNPANWCASCGPSQYDIHTREPESLNVGQLNRVVRELREALYQQKLLTQAGLEKLAAVGRWAETWRLSPTRTRRYCAGVLADILGEPPPSQAGLAAAAIAPEEKP